MFCAKLVAEYHLNVQASLQNIILNVLGTVQQPLLDDFGEPDKKETCSNLTSHFGTDGDSDFRFRIGYLR